MGENCLGSGVSVARNTYAREGKVCVGTAVGRSFDAETTCPVHAVNTTETTKIKREDRLIVHQYSGEKLSCDEFYATLALCHIKVSFTNTDICWISRLTRKQ
jgi:hypothetical protein